MAMAVSQSSVLATVMVAAGRAACGQSVRAVVPETVLRTTVPSARSWRVSRGRSASGLSAGTAATRSSVVSSSVTRPGASTAPRSRAASTSPRVRPHGAVVDAEEFERGVGVVALPAPEQRGGVRAEGRPGVSEAQGPVAEPGGVDGGIEGGECGGGPVPEGAALGGEGEVVGGAVDEPGAEVLFEGGEGAGDGGLGEVEPGGRSGEAGLLGDGEEAAEVA